MRLEGLVNSRVSNFNCRLNPLILFFKFDTDYLSNAIPNIPAPDILGVPWKMTKDFISSSVKLTLAAIVRWPNIIFISSNIEQILTE